MINYVRIARGDKGLNGWRCPKCGVINNPFTLYCKCEPLIVSVKTTDVKEWISIPYKSISK